MKGISLLPCDKQGWCYFIVGFLLCCAAISSYGAQGSSTVSLRQAEQVALQRAPEIKVIRAKAKALQDTAVASGQLHDPTLEFNAQNLPTDTFRLNQEAMTQLQLGISQAFPRGKTLKYTRLQNQQLATAEHIQSTVMQDQILQQVRIAWIHLYYWQRARILIRQQQQVFQHLYDVTKALLANNKAQQKDVIQAQLELNDLNNRLMDTQQQIDTARADLARWIGVTLAQHVHPQHLPHWPAPPSYQQLQQVIRAHPEINHIQRIIAANQAKVLVAKQQYKPGIVLGLKYGYREGRNFDKRERSDLMTGNIRVDLPFFTKNRQDKTLSASESSLIASQEQRQTRYNQLHEDLAVEYAAWRTLSARQTLYQKTLIPEAKTYAQSTLIAYQNDKTDFHTLADSYIRDLGIRLSGLKVNTERAKARINLLYLQGR